MKMVTMRSVGRLKPRVVSIYEGVCVRAIVINLPAHLCVFFAAGDIEIRITRLNQLNSVSSAIHGGAMPKEVVVDRNASRFYCDVDSYEIEIRTRPFRSTGRSPVFDGRRVGILATLQRMLSDGGASSLMSLVTTHNADLTPLEKKLKKYLKQNHGNVT